MTSRVLYNTLFLGNTTIYISSEHCVTGDLRDGVGGMNSPPG